MNAEATAFLVDAFDMLIARRYGDRKAASKSGLAVVELEELVGTN